MGFLDDIQQRIRTSLQKRGFQDQQGQSPFVSGSSAADQTGSEPFVGPVYSGPQQTTTTQTSGGDGGGTSDGGGTVSTGDQSAPYESAPSEPQIDYDAMFAPAFDALNQQVSASEALNQAQTGEAELGSAQRKQGLESEQTSRLQGFGEQRTEASQTTGSAVEQARRQASELLQGIQARFGGTTGSGRFRSEVIGGQTTRNIAMNQQALQNTMGKIGQAENNLRTKVTELISNEDANLENQKTQLRAHLQQALADIGTERGRLESEKAQRRIDTLNQYQQVVQQVNARNAQFKQSLFQQSQDAQNSLEELRQRAQQSHKVSAQKLDFGDVSSLLKSGAINQGQAQRGTIGSDVTGQSLEDIFGQATGTSQQDDTESLLGINNF